MLRPQPSPTTFKEWATQNPIKPYFCIQDANGNITYALASDATIDANLYSGNPYYIGGTLRFGGCKTDDTYLGYVGLLVNEQHQTDLSKKIINVHQYLDNDYSGTHDSCNTNILSTGQDGYNLEAFVAYLRQNKLKAMITEFGSGNDEADCSTALTSMLNYLKDNSAKDKDYGFVGWTMWSAGHGWGNYHLRVTPDSYKMTVLKQFL